MKQIRKAVMRTRCCIILLGCLILLGCRKDPYLDFYVEELNAEKIWLEDQLYALEYEYEKQAKELAELKAQRESVNPSREVITTPGAPPRTNSDTPRVPSFSLPRAPSAPSAPKEPEIPDLQEPVIDPGQLIEPEIDPNFVPQDLNDPAEQAPPPGFAPPRLEPPAADPQRRYRLPAPGEAEANLEEAETVMLGSGPPVQIVLNPKQTGGQNYDTAPGDDGLRVVIEPRDSNGGIVPLTGAVSLVLLDPAQEGENARIARWDFDSSETRFVGAAGGRGVEFQLRWPAAPPLNSDLHLFVRCETPQGDFFVADQKVHVSLPGAYSERWTPRPGEAGSNIAAKPQQAPADSTPKPLLQKPEWSPYR